MNVLCLNEMSVSKDQQDKLPYSFSSHNSKKSGDRWIPVITYADKKILEMYSCKKISSVNPSHLVIRRKPAC